VNTYANYIWVGVLRYKVKGFGYASFKVLKPTQTGGNPSEEGRVKSIYTTAQVIIMAQALKEMFHRR